MDNNVKQSGEKIIGDMYLAAAMIAYGVPLLRVDSTNPKRQLFIFRNVQLPSIIISSDDVVVMPLHNATVEDLDTYYISGRLWLPPSYSNSIKNTKSILHRES